LIQKNSWLKYQILKNHNQLKALKMDANKILTADALDLIFEGRYKDFGAYELRKTYSKRITIALIAMLIIAAMFSTGAILSNGSKKKTKAAETFVEDVSLVDNKTEKEKLPPPPPPPPKQEPPKVELAKFTPPKIVKDAEVEKKDEIKEQDKLDDVKISSFDQKGEKVDVVAAPVEASTGPVAPPREETDEIFTSVQIQSSFPGGPEAWSKFLTRTLNRDLPVENGAPAGIYKVIVSFVVARDGSISDVKAENDPGYGTAAEAVRVIQKGPKWTPAEQNGHKVIYRHRQVIGFQVTED
jgi:protein TonB